MPKDATKNIDRYKIRGGQLNEFEYAQGQKALAEKKPKGGAKLIPGTPPEEAMEGLRPGVAAKTSKATKSTKGQATESTKNKTTKGAEGKGTKATGGTKGQAAKGTKGTKGTKGQAAKKTTKKAAKKATKNASSIQGATAKKLAARKTAARKK